MGLLVQKYGGTSVGSLARITEVAKKIAAAHAAGDQLLVVVSAMAGETDRLIKLAKHFGDHPEPREYAMLVATGEQASIALLTMALQQLGLKARSYTGSQVPIITEDRYKRARIVDVEVERLQADLDAGYIVVVAGFQGINQQDEITTLGRGGSDTTAVALAAALKARECQIYTDVDGVYTADPRVVSAAKRLDTVNFDEMIELASLGAKVLQNRAVEFAGKYQVPLRVLSSFEEGEGTLVTFADDSNKTMEKPVVSGIAYNRSEAKLTILGVPDTPGVASDIIGPIGAAGIDIDMIIQNVASDGTTDFTFTVHRDDYTKTLNLLQEIANKLGAGTVSGDDKIAKLSIVGMGMRAHAGIASTMFDTLGAEGINIRMISTSEIKVSVVVDEKYLELGLRALHSAFGLDQQAEEEFDPVLPKNEENG